MTGEENPDFDFRVVKETQVISLDPAVKPFIPQSMSGYTGNANTPPSVLNKMFNTGVLGQTPAFVPEVATLAQVIQVLGMPHQTH